MKRILLVVVIAVMLAGCSKKEVVSVIMYEKTTAELGDKRVSMFVMPIQTESDIVVFAGDGMILELKDGQPELMYLYYKFPEIKHTSVNVKLLPGYCYKIEFDNAGNFSLMSKLKSICDA